jgi:hypothetical protein
MSYYGLNILPIDSSFSLRTEIIVIIDIFLQL